MNSSTLRLLGLLVLALVAVLAVIEMGGSGDSVSEGGPLLPGFRDRLNDVTAVTITRAGGETLAVSKAADAWTVDGRDGYPANVSRIREVLLAMADAKSIEPKTSNPELYGRLGVDDLDSEGSKGVLVSATGDDFSHELVFGNVAQVNYRYARIAGEAQSWLIDQNPDIPDSAGALLAADIVDIDAARVRSVTIIHPDGEVIRVSKASEEATDFDVADIPDGRELSYSTVANGIGGALNDLDLDDVSRGVVLDDGVITVIDTFDGLSIEVRSAIVDDANWITLAVSSADDADEEAAALGDRVSGWQYMIADYKANLLRRRWEDILKTETDVVD